MINKQFNSPAAAVADIHDGATILIGGFGAALLQELSELGVALPARCLGTPDALVEHGAKLSELGLDAAGIAEAVRDLVGERDSS